MKTAIKDFLGWTIFASRLDAILLRDAAVIVAFHRVQETVDPDDGLTISGSSACGRSSGSWSAASP